MNLSITAPWSNSSNLSHTTEWPQSSKWPHSTEWPHTRYWPHTTQWPHHLASTLYDPLPSQEPTTNHSDSLLVDGPSLADIMQGMVPFRTALMLVTWLFPLVVVVGVAGNLVSLWVLLRRGMRRTSACRYLACLAVADMVVLLVSALKTWVRVVWGFELLHLSNVTCKLFIFLTHLSLMAAAWLIVAVTLERFLAVWMPLRATQVCSVGRTRVVVVALLVLLALLNSHVFWTAQLLPVSPQRSLSSSGVQCSSYAYRTVTCRVFPWVHLALYCFLPAALLLALNSLILFKLFRHRRAVPPCQDSRGSRSSSNRTTANNHLHLHYHHSQAPNHQTKLLLKQQCGTVVVVGGGGCPSSSSRPPHRFHRRLAPMLLGVSLCWLLLTTPQTLYTLAAPAPTSLHQAAAHFLVKTVCFLLMYINHAIHFFLYCMTGQRFRQELRRGLVCSDSHSTYRLKKGFLPKGPGQDQLPLSQQGYGVDGEGEAAMAEDQPVLANDVHGNCKEHPLEELTPQSEVQRNLPFRMSEQQQLLRIQTPNGIKRELVKP